LGLVVDKVAESRHESFLGEQKYAHDDMVEVRVHVNWLVVPERLSDILGGFSDVTEGLELIL
jgi:hypothetical protein